MGLEGDTRLMPGEPSRPPKSAYLVRFPEDVWQQIQACSGGITVSMDAGMHLNIPGHDPISLKSQQTGAASEIHQLRPTKDAAAPSALHPYALATARLSLPLSSASTSKAANRMKAQNEAFDKQRKDRADRVNGVKAPSAVTSLKNTESAAAMGRTHSSPPVSAAYNSAPPTPMIPLKTRVVQLLALGAQSIDEIVRRVGMTEAEVMRVVKVVGRETSDGCYTLQPSKYSQVKIGPWKYTYAEKMQVIKLARAAYDELDLPPTAEERIELEKKENEVLSGPAAAPDPPPAPPPAPVAAPLPVTVEPTSIPPPPKKKEKAASGSKKNLGLIGKQKAKFAAEKRAASLPNVKQDGMASPRSEVSALAESPAKGKRKREEEDLVASRKKGASPASTQSSDEARGRPRDKLPVKEPSRTSTPVPTANGKQQTMSSGKRSSREYSSSESDSDKPLRAKDKDKDKDKLPERPPRPPAESASSRTFKRKPPPAELKLNGDSNLADPPDPDALRERYDELFPAYQLLTQKLASLHRRAEGEEEGEVVEMDPKELGRMVTRWEKWHVELQGIRRWFGDD